MTPGIGLTVDVPGWVVPCGKSVRNVGAVESVAVKFSATALAPEAGTDPVPPTCRSIVWPGPTGVPVSRVSRMRSGVTAWNEEPVGNHPATSTIRLVEPSSLNSDTLPPGPSPTSTRLLSGPPGAALSDDVGGLGSSLPHAVM